MGLVEILNQLETVDEEMKKEAAEMEKMAAEEEAAGRIAARGFLDELCKLAQGPSEIIERQQATPEPKQKSIPTMQEKPIVPVAKTERPRADEDSWGTRKAIGFPHRHGGKGSSIREIPPPQPRSGRRAGKIWVYDR